MRIFVASSYLNKRKARQAMEWFRIRGHTITFDWTRPERGKTAWYLRKKALADFNGVMDADLLVVIWPGRLGTATEIGIALGKGIPVIIVGQPDVMSIYWYYPDVRIVPTLKDVFQ